MIRRPPRSTQSRSSAASDVYKRQFEGAGASPAASDWGASSARASAKESPYAPMTATTATAQAMNLLPIISRFLHMLLQRAAPYRIGKCPARRLGVRGLAVDARQGPMPDDAHGRQALP